MRGYFLFSLVSNIQTKRIYQTFRGQYQAIHTCIIGKDVFIQCLKLLAILPDFNLIYPFYIQYIHRSLALYLSVLNRLSFKSVYDLISFV